jgi:4-aminobutyrate---pyruvate transaminase
MERADSLAARDVKSLVHPFTNLAQHAVDGPLVIARGEGVFVYDEDSKRYLEGMAGLWCTSLGFSEKRLVEAAIDQLERLPTYHMFGGKSHPPGIELAEHLLRIAPVPMARAMFVGSGSEANDTAIKLVRYYHHARGRPEKRKIIARVRGYHGVTLVCASVTGLPHLHRDFGLPLEGVLHAGCPHYYREGWPGETEEQFATRLAGDLERLILREGPDTVGAFIAEPIMGAGGVIMPPAAYFELIQAVLDKYEVLLIADEVITAFGRTGNMFGCQTYGIRPDLITVAKALSSGYQPIGAVLISEPIHEIMLAQSQKIGTFGHGHTYAGHPICAAVALRTLQIYEQDDILGRVAEVAPYFAARLHALASHPLVGQARAVGLIGALELMADAVQKVPFEPGLTVGPRLVKECQRRGVILRAVGDTITFCPPLIIARSELELLFDTVTAALDVVAGELAPKKSRRVA